MSLLQKYQVSAKAKALTVLSGGVAKLDSLQVAYAENFSYPSLSAASAAFSAIDVTTTSNAAVSKAVMTTLDAVDSMSQDAQTLDIFVNLHIPKMEDGNNFGVTVQLALLKEITDLQEKAKSRIEELAGYANARADAIEKLKLPSASSSVTKSVSTGTTDGKKEDKTSESTEDKTTTNDSSGVAYASRVAALIACDVLYYSKAQRAFQSVMTAYAGMVDFLDKNQEKLERPKGSGGSHSGFASMY